MMFQFSCFFFSLWKNFKKQYVSKMNLCLFHSSVVFACILNSTISYSKQVNFFAEVSEKNLNLILEKLKKKKLLTNKLQSY